MNALAYKSLPALWRKNISRAVWLAMLVDCHMAAAVAGSESGSTGNLEEVIVSAQRREENLSNVPISISVLGGANLEKPTIASVSDALSTIPGVAVVSGGQSGGQTVAIRGVAPSGALFFGGPTTAYYLDAVPFGLVKQGFAPNSNPYDLERVEVLRGPQGTLYGASALNGVVRVLTKNPDLDGFDLKARTSLSSTKGGDTSYGGDVAVNVPLVQGKLAARVVAGYEGQGGWVDKPNLNAKDVNSGEISNVRLKVKAQPTDKLSIGLSAWHSREDYEGISQAVDGWTDPALLDESVLVDYDLYGLTVGYDFAAFSLTSTTSYLNFHNESVGDISWATPGFLTFISTLNDSDVWAQELVLNSRHEGPWRWTLGGIFRNAEEDFGQALAFNAPAPVAPIPGCLSCATVESESYAVFGEATRMFFDGQFELTAGLRYFNDDVTVDEVGQPLGNGSYDALSPRFVATWHPQDQLLVYGSYSEGFRSGSPEYAHERLAGIPDLEPDTLKNYEVGTKGGLLSGRFNYEMALYYIDWQDIQQTRTVPDPSGSGIPVSALLNGDSASGLGVDLGLTAIVGDGLTVGVSIGWNDLTFDEPVFTGDPPVMLANAGDRIAFSPEYTIGASTEYAFQFGGGYEGRFSASANYTSSQLDRNLAGTTVLTTTGDSIVIGRASLSIDTPNHWAATLFVNNVGNEGGVITTFPFPGIVISSRPRPRTMGVQLEFRFGK